MEESISSDQEDQNKKR